MTPPDYSREPMDIVSVRTFAAPRAEVYAAFANPARLSQWWGPRGFTNTFHAFELRPGGMWRFTMHGPDGQTYELTKQFVEIVPAEKIVLRHVQSQHTFAMTMTFDEPSPQQTRLTWRMVFEPSPSNAAAKSFIVDANEQNFDRLAQHLSSTV